MDNQSPAAKLWLALDLPESSLSYLTLSDHPDPAINSIFKLGTASQTAIGLSALSAAQFHALRASGGMQRASVDARHAVLEFRSEQWYTIDGQEPDWNAFWDPVHGLYEAKDGGYVHIHTNFPHHRKGVLDILHCDATRESVSKALLDWNSEDFETEASSRNMCATAMRSFEEWDKHPQGIALAGVPPVSLLKIGDAPKRFVQGSCSRPLEGIRVLDLTRVLAGPVCARTLAAHGADVLLITSPNLPGLPILDIQTSRGKRTTQLDLEDANNRAVLASLAKDADVFLQAYRPNGLRDKGFGPADVAQARPGIVYASLTAYGWEGPWSDRRGFDSLVQTATGFNVAEAQGYALHTGNVPSGPLSPRPLPMQALDHAAGYFLAFGINAALCKTITEGGSWEVRVSLAGVGQWIRSLGTLDPHVGFGRGVPYPLRKMPQDPEIAALLVTSRECRSELDDGDPGARRKMTVIRHAADLERTPVREGDAPMGLNVHTPEWMVKRTS